MRSISTKFATAFSVFISTSTDMAYNLSTSTTSL